MDCLSSNETEKTIEFISLDLAEKPDIDNSKVHANEGNSDGTDQMVIYCSICNVQFFDVHNLEEHLTLEHISKPFQCKFCINCFSLQVQLEEHLKLHVDEERPYKCYLCTVTLKNEETVTKHMNKKHNRDMKCQHCIQHFQHSGDLKAHELAHEFKSYPCMVCETNFYQTKLLDLHLNVHADESPFECPDCGDLFEDINMFSEHTTVQCKCDEKKTETVPKPDKKESLDDDFNLSEFIKLEYGEFSENNFDCDYEDDDEEPEEIVVEDKSEKEEHKCPICNMLFKELKDYKQHCEGHRKEDKMVSEDGTVYVKIATKTRNHSKPASLEWQKRDNKQRPFHCQICKRSFTLASTLSLHNKRTHLGIRPHECKVCAWTFAQSSDLIKHLRKHTGERPYTCSHCGLGFTQNRNLKNHMKMHTEAPSKCKYCDKSFAIDTSLIQHLKKHEGPTAKECDFCKIPFTDDHDMDVHMKRFHTDGKPHKCAYCDKKFSKSSDLVKHNRTHTGERPFSCTVCERTFAHPTSLRNHQLVHTGEKPFQCSYCGQSFSFSGNLKVHIRSHTGEKPYTCTVCGKSFARTANLNEHLKIHTGEKNHKCDICGKSFTNSSTYSKHKKIHTGERPHQCQWCFKTFIQLAHLAKHVRIHTGEKPFECVTCKKCFRRSDTLAAHMKTHRSKDKTETSSQMPVVMAAPEEQTLQVSIQHEENPPQIIHVPQTELITMPAHNYQTSILLPTIQIAQPMVQVQTLQNHNDQVLQFSLQPTLQMTTPGNISYQQLIQWTTQIDQ